MTLPEEQPQDIILSNYYTASQATEVLRRNSNRPDLQPDYVRKLGQKGVFHPIRVDSNRNLYPKFEVDNYVVEDRGAKAGRAAKTRAQAKQAGKTRAASKKKA